MSVRDMKGNPGMWEKLGWSDMSREEQGLWAVLGWSQSGWDRNSPPESADKYWDNLTPQEQSAAMRLGFTQAAWDATEDE